MTVRVQRLSPDYLVVGIPNTVSITFDDSDETMISNITGDPVTGNWVAYSLYDDNGKVLTAVDQMSATWSASTRTASYTIPAADLVGVSYSSNYRGYWEIYAENPVPGPPGVLQLAFDVDTLIVRARPYAPLTTADLQRRNSELIGDYALPSGRTSWHDYIDEAFAQLVSRLTATGVGVHEIASWHGFREYVARCAEYMIARDLMVTRSGATKWRELWEVLGGAADDPRSVEWAWAQLGYRIDRNQDGIPDTDAKAESKPGSYYQTTSDSGWRGF
jgi:hypothetical protein